MATALTTTWTVEIQLDEHEGVTRARAQLRTDDGTAVTRTGTAHLAPEDRDVPAIGRELAAGRALRALSERLVGQADHDIDAATQPPADTAWLA